MVMKIKPNNVSYKLYKSDTKDIGNSDKDFFIFTLNEINISYADNMVLLSPLVSGLKKKQKIVINGRR